MRIERDDFIIQGVPWKVREADVLSVTDDAYGYLDPDTHTIWIASSACWEEKIESLIHETFHALTRGRLKYDLTQEDDLRTFSIALVDTILRNQLTFCPDEGGW
jgi:hypothetical protein